ncbi:GNAT family N-acetyltransferase [Planctomyces sp. SH-PL14]|uniref:GNAT family N-acetyltransferase n=1 Tax=Planctomyces sp. SH-PL14 TaxID=1632864 RepID=UPI00078CD1BD|nr:GNAT family N-acetyltransferase [Planctomyces sp. SH-PL14]AMV16559.1 Mycothiol acetyltransferase [Planctomyces sp. SH-PL14]
MLSPSRNDGSGSGGLPITIRKFEWEPDEELSSRTWAYSASIGGVPVAVQAVVFRADRTVLYLPPDVRIDSLPPGCRPEPVLREIVSQVNQDLTGLDVCFCQAAVDPEDELARTALTLAGFRYLTDVTEFTRNTTAADAPRGSFEPARDIRLETPPLTSDLWVRAFEASLADSVDVPELLDFRGPRESFESLALLAGGHTEHWRVLMDEDHPIGLVLPTLLPDGTAEIQYLGVASSHRRRGHGTRLLQHAFEATGSLEISSLNVHVDSRNVAAAALYQRYGFGPVTRRSLWIR